MGSRDLLGTEGLLLDVIYAADSAVLAERRGMVARRLSERGVDRHILDTVLPGWSAYLVARRVN